MKILFAGILVLLFVSCDNTSSGVKHDSVPDSTGTDSVVAVPSDIITDTFYEDETGTYIKEIRRNGVLEHRIAYNELADTTFYPNGKPAHVRIGPSDDFDAIQYEYYTNGQLRQKHRQGNTFGCGNAIGPNDNYDSMGHHLSHVEYYHYLPHPDDGCHSTMTVIHTTLYYLSGVDSVHMQQETGYEAAVECPCGTWEYFDSTGKLIRKEKFEKCKDGKMECDE